MTEKTLEKIYEAAVKAPSDKVIYSDLFDACRGVAEDGDVTSGHRYNRMMRELLSGNMRKMDNISAGFEIYRNSLLFDAPVDLDAYMLYLEIDRKPEERFYQPRRKRLYKLVTSIQKLEDDSLDELFLALPPRVGKTSTLLFTMSWLLGKHTESSNLYSAYSDIITKAFYNGILEIINDKVTYKWKDVFPNSEIAQTNAQDEIIDMNRKKRYPTLTARSLYGTLNGAVDCNGFLIADDLIGGIEEAMNKDRLIAAWSKVDNNLIPRAKEKCKLLWCGTRWSLMDPTGLRMDLLQNDERFKDRRYQIISVPALDDKDESNFEYDYNVGFSSDYYKERRASFERNNDMASWLAQYQGQPIERQGSVFSPEDLRYYNGTLPDEKPDRIFMAGDPAFGGGDFVAAPVCYQYGNDIYVHDVVYNNADKSVTQPLVAKTIMTNSVNAAQFEGTKATDSYKTGVEEILKQSGYRLNITSKAAPSQISKVNRIFDKASDIRQMMIFRESGKRSKEYDLFMQNVFSFKILGKNKNDDAPDSLAMAIDMVIHPASVIQVLRRPF